MNNCKGEEEFEKEIQNVTLKVAEEGPIVCVSAKKKDSVNLSQKVCDRVHDKEGVKGTILKFSVVIIIR